MDVSFFPQFTSSYMEEKTKEKKTDTNSQPTDPTLATCVPVERGGFLHHLKRYTLMFSCDRKLSDGLFLKTCREVSEFYPDIQFEDLIVDNCCMQVCTSAMIVLLYLNNS